MIPRLALVLLLAACAAAPTVESVTTAVTVPPTTTTTILRPADVYALVSPALAFVETPVGSGSAVLVDSHMLVTNAHVVWPEQEVTVSFPNGPTGVVAVVGFDWMADLAVLDVSSLLALPAPAELETSPPEPGAAVYLVGYPADDPGTAAPAITAGIVSRTRTWADGGMTFIQSDTLISGGQSGGALVDEFGRVVGISGLSIGDGFALALTTGDVITRLASVISGDDMDGLGARSVAALTGPTGNTGSVPYELDEAVFVFDGRAGDSVTIEVTGSAPLNVDLVGPDGFVEASSDHPDVSAVLTAELILDGPYFIVVYPDLEPLDFVEVTGAETRLWHDPDHGRILEIGTPLTANGDYPGDLDWFSLDLAAGQVVTITASSINIDASLLVDHLVPVGESAFVSDSDSAGGVIGFDAVVEFTAPTTGSYAVAVFDETGFGPGGYIVTVEEGRR